MKPELSAEEGFDIEELFLSSHPIKYDFIDFSSTEDNYLSLI